MAFMSNDTVVPGTVSVKFSNATTSAVQMTADALQVELLFVFLVIKVGRDAVLTDPRRIQLLVALFARLVVDDLHGMLQLSLALPVERRAILGQIGPHVPKPGRSLGHEILERPPGREMTLGAAGNRAATAVVMVGRAMHIHAIQSNRNAHADGESS